MAPPARALAAWLVATAGMTARALAPSRRARRGTETRRPASVGDALAAGPKRQRYAAGLTALTPPAPGTEFMHPMLVAGASKLVRESGAAAILVDDAATCAAVAGDVAATDTPVAVVWCGDGAAPDAADAALARCDAEGVAGASSSTKVPCVAGLADAAALQAACAAAAAAGAEALVVAGGADPLDAGPAEDLAVPVLRALKFAVGDDAEALDDEAFACGVKGYAGVALVGVAGADPTPVGDLSAALAAALEVLRSKRSRTFSGAWSSAAPGDLLTTEAQDEAVKWGRYMETTTKAGIVAEMNSEGGREIVDEDFDEERGDYKVFGGVPPAAPAEKVRPTTPEPGSEREAALKTLKDKGWNN